MVGSDPIRWPSDGREIPPLMSFDVQVAEQPVLE
jgi:hypothetical protein